MDFHREQRLQGFYKVSRPSCILEIYHCDTDGNPSFNELNKQLSINDQVIM